jgi:uncharacterized protein YuzE
VRFIYDPVSDSGFIAVKEIGPGESIRQVRLHDESLHGHIVVHLDREDHVIGLEFPLHARAMLPPELLDQTI